MRPLRAAPPPRRVWREPQAAMTTTAPVRPRQEVLDRQAFAVRLWNPPPPAPVVKKEAPSSMPQAAPLRMTLLGIIAEPGRRCAAVLYDQENDAIITLEPGQRIKGHTVVEVDPQSIELSDGRHARRLKLADPGATP